MKKIELIIGVFYTIITIIIHICYQLNKIDYICLLIPDLLFFIIMILLSIKVILFPQYEDLTLCFIITTIAMASYAIRICCFI